MEDHLLSEKKHKVNVYIGIDTGVHTGIAIWNSSLKKFTKLLTLDFWGCINLLELEKVVNDNNFMVYIEDPTQNKPIFKNKLVGKEVASQLKIAQNVGSVKRETSLMIEWMRDNDIAHIAVKPTKKTLSKLTSENFQHYTGYLGVCSQHARDAAMLVFGL